MRYVLSRTMRRAFPRVGFFDVARNDGTHQFSRTVAEHNAAVVKFQRGGKALQQ